MKSKSLTNIMGLMLLIISLFIISSCSKNADQSSTKEQQDDILNIDEKDLLETDADLQTVDYKVFYDLLSANGEWVEVNAKEIGVKQVTELNIGSEKKKFAFSDMLGVNSAYAEDGSEMIFVWKPFPTLAVTSTTPEETPEYVPYSNGQWVNSDAGWYFKAPTPVEEAVSHYGRWVNSDGNWLWVPGRVWSPAWVDWKQNDEFVSWAPLPPSSYLVNNIITPPVIDDNNYVIVDRKYFLEPKIYTYYNPYYADGNKVLVSDLKRTDGIVVVNNTIINRGPDVNIIEKLYGKTVEMVKIQRVVNNNDVKYADKEYYVYSPKFKKYKVKNNPSYKINLPKSYKKYDEWKEVKKQQKELNKEVKEQQKEYNKEVKKEQKEIIKDLKNNNNNNNGNKNEEKRKNNKNSGNENVKYEKEKKNESNDDKRSGNNKGNNKEKKNK
ncbi:MAG: DUF6600 domain-containing protein [Candidatus Kapaibacterium sp.]